MKYINILNIVVMFLCILLTSCLGVFYIDLGNHYAWLEDRIIYKIKEESEKGLYGDVIIRPQVLNYNYDDQYIIVYQIYDGDDFFYDISAKQDKAEKDSLYAQFDKIKEIKYFYWIIDKETDQVIGPLRKDDFDRKCQELHIEIKMHRFHEKKFWENRSMKELGIDSADVVRKEADKDTVTR